MYDPYVGKKERGSRAEAAPPAAGRSLHADESTLAAEWPWSKDAGGEDFGDHFETPKRAYRDIKPVLRKEAQRREIEESALRLYDPYFCRGAMVTHLNSLGFANVINAKRDFYADIAADRVPAHDVLVTNPPYSGEHKAKLFAWLLEQHRAALKAGGDCRPFMLLLPAWTAKWLPWRTFLWAMARLRSGKLDTTIEDAMEKAKKLSNLSDQLEVNAGVFYLAPETKYEYEAAVAAREEAPFFGVWFCGGFPDNATREAAVAAIEKRASKEEKGTTACVIPTLRALVEAGHAVGVEQERFEALMDPAKRKRRDEGIAKLEDARKQKPRKRNYEERKKEKYVPKDAIDAQSLPARLQEDDNEKCCRHYFVGEGCTLGAKCRFSHTLQ